MVGAQDAREGPRTVCDNANACHECDEVVRGTWPHGRMELACARSSAAMPSIAERFFSFRTSATNAMTSAGDGIGSSGPLCVDISHRLLSLLLEEEWVVEDADWSAAP